MNDYTPFFIIMIVAPVLIITVSSVGYVFYGTENYTGYITDVSYSQSGFGSTDITVVYFGNKTLVLNSNVEINRYCNATITWHEDRFIQGKQFVAIEYMD